MTNRKLKITMNTMKEQESLLEYKNKKIEDTNIKDIINSLELYTDLNGNIDNNGPDYCSYEKNVVAEKTFVYTSYSSKKGNKKQQEDIYNDIKLSEFINCNKINNFKPHQYNTFKSKLTDFRNNIISALKSKNNKIKKHDLSYDFSISVLILEIENSIHLSDSDEDFNPFMEREIYEFLNEIDSLNFNYILYTYQLSNKIHTIDTEKYKYTEIKLYEESVISSLVFTLPQKIEFAIGQNSIPSNILKFSNQNTILNCREKNKILIADLVFRRVWNSTLFKSDSGVYFDSHYCHFILEEHNLIKNNHYVWIEMYNYLISRDYLEIKYDDGLVENIPIIKQYISHRLQKLDKRNDFGLLHTWEKHAIFVSNSLFSDDIIVPFHIKQYECVDENGLAYSNFLELNKLTVIINTYDFWKNNGFFVDVDYKRILLSIEDEFDEQVKLERYSEVINKFKKIIR